MCHVCDVVIEFGFHAIEWVDDNDGKDPRRRQVGHALGLGCRSWLGSEEDGSRA